MIITTSDWKQHRVNKMFNVLWFPGFILTTKTHSNTDATPPVLQSQQAIIFLTALLFITKIISNTTNKDLPWRYGLYQRPSSEENGTNSSCGSCHGSDVTWQEIICRTCGSVCSTPLCCAWEVTPSLSDTTIVPVTYLLNFTWSAPRISMQDIKALCPISHVIQRLAFHGEIIQPLAGGSCSSSSSNSSH